MLSVIVNVHNMRREAPRTLFTLTPGYQQGVSAADYEVLVVDNGSDTPLTQQDVSRFGSNFRYYARNFKSPSPVQALNAAVKKARGQWLMLCIDGARMLSPNVLKYTLQLTRMETEPFIYTMGMHIGSQPQNESIAHGYNQQTEDELLDSVDWRSDGYRLFDISCTALSSRGGYFSSFSESNAFALSKKMYNALGGLDERFQSPGGGLVNLDFFNLVHEDKRLQPFLLLGEASFHQFHGGIATNVKMSEHPWVKMEEEYRMIRGKSFASSWYPPCYYGEVSQHVKNGLLIKS